MKNLKTIAMISTMTAGLVASSLARADGALNGTYQVQSNACNSLYAVGSKIQIQADAQSLSYGIIVPTQLTNSGFGLETQFSANVGTYVSSGEGQQVRDSANYVDGGNRFVYTQTFLAGPVQPSDEITREVQIIKNGNTVTLHDSESGDLGPACVLTAADL
jgi:hypothetical protein